MKDIHIFDKHTFSSQLTHSDQFESDSRLKPEEEQYWHGMKNKDRETYTAHTQGETSETSIYQKWVKQQEEGDTYSGKVTG